MGDDMDDTLVLADDTLVMADDTDDTCDGG